PLDAEDDQRDRERVLGEDRARHRVGRADDGDVLAEAGEEGGAEAPEEVDVLGLLAGEVEEGAGARELARHLGADVVEDEGQDELLDEPEHVEVAVAAELVEDQTLAGREELEAFDTGEALGHERPREVEALRVIDQVLDAPGDALRGIEDALEVGGGAGD